MTWWNNFDQQPKGLNKHKIHTYHINIITKIHEKNGTSLIAEHDHHQLWSLRTYFIAG